MISQSNSESSNPPILKAFIKEWVRFHSKKYLKVNGPKIFSHHRMNMSFRDGSQILNLGGKSLKERTMREFYLKLMAQCILDKIQWKRGCFKGFGFLTIVFIPPLLYIRVQFVN